MIYRVNSIKFKNMEVTTLVWIVVVYDVHLLSKLVLFCLLSSAKYEVI